MEINTREYMFQSGEITLIWKLCVMDRKPILFTYDHSPNILDGQTKSVSSGTQWPMYQTFIWEKNC